MHTDFLGAWNDFYVATAGATAALAGLIIVAMSVNIERILKAATLPARAASSLSALLLSLIVACIGLMPTQPSLWIGTEILAGTLIASLFQIRAIQVILGEQDTAPPARWAKTIPGILPLASFAVGGSLVADGNPAGLYWVAAGILLAIVVSVLFAWIALVEILR